MNKTTLCLLAVLAGAGQGMALAEPPAQDAKQPVETVRIPGQIDRIDLPATSYGMNVTNFASYRGSYDLSNGQELSLLAGTASMYAILDNGRKVRLIGAGTDTFVAEDRSLHMRLWRGIDGEVGGELLLAQPADMAGLDAPLLRMAMHR
ncbi:hypothetical protein [Pseudoduganella violacea]|uniref:Uncharacterized protein n=1 Tax=Pseudoduganella violacea TaxID=1715466 RepID=A0A7W5FV25_9BURK|nr:hypothetical protein [Pseudoduganella violacea]MBB3120352.1 hypothetical protein [Pseudoduganella violacea]